MLVEKILEELKWSVDPDKAFEMAIRLYKEGEQEAFCIQQALIAYPLR
jgi:hypothetical protein